MILAQLEVLDLLEQAPEGQYSLKELEHILHVAQSTAAGIIFRLEQKGFVEGFGDTEDRWIERVRITPAGAECVHTALHYRVETEKKLLSSLTEAERDFFICF